jgi:hypothetical protein
VVLGIRAYNTLDQLKTRQPELLRYVEAGGNLVVQYTVARGTVLPQIGPLSAHALQRPGNRGRRPRHLPQPPAPPAGLAQPAHGRRFQGWVQEQGLYYPSAWDAKYTPIMVSNDPGETPKQGAIW